MTDHDAIAARVRQDRMSGTMLTGPVYIKLADMADAYLDLHDEVKRLRGELAQANNEFGSETAEWPALWRRIAELKDISNDRWQRAEKAEAERADEWTRRREAEASRDLEKAVCATIKAERDALRAALVEHNDLLRSASQIAKREGIDGEIASTNWDAYYNRVAVVLKRHHEISNTARAALKGDSDE